jgi:hypothetical protein
MGQTIVEKIAQSHMAEGPKRRLRAGDIISIRPRHVMTHDNTSAVMKKFKTIGADRIRNPHQLVFALDHDIQNTEETNLAKYRSIEAFARAQGVDFYPAGTGIGHQIMVEKGYARRLRGRLRFPVEHVRRSGGRRDAGGAHRRRFHLGHGRNVVANPAHRAGGAHREAAAGRDGKGRHHHSLRAVQQGRSLECGGGIYRPRRF